MPSEESAAPVRRTPKAGRSLRGPGTAAAPAITVYGMPGKEVDVLPLSSLNLLLTTGRVNHADVLVPYVELRLLRQVPGDDSPEPVDAFAGVVTYENAAFLLMDLAGDMANLTKQLAQVATGEVKLEGVRRAYAVDCLREAREKLGRCLETLEAAAVVAPAKKTKAARPVRRPPAARSK